MAQKMTFYPTMLIPTFFHANIKINDNYTNRLNDEDYI